MFFFYGSAAALCAGRAALSAGLPVICARAVLSQEVLVLHILGRRSRARVDLNRQKRHFRHFLQHRGMIYSLSRVFAPCERPMAAADDTGHMDRINVPRTECLNDDRSGIFS